jgi:hypothetical protein
MICNILHVTALYNIPKASLAQEGNEMGIFELGDMYDQEDLDIFFTTFASNIPNGTHPTLDSIDGGMAPVTSNEAGGESILDFELAFSLVYPQKINLFQVDDQFIADEFLFELGSWDTFLDAVDGVSFAKTIHVALECLCESCMLTAKYSFCTFQGGDNKTVDPQYVLIVF